MKSGYVASINWCSSSHSFGPSCMSFSLWILIYKDELWKSLSNKRNVPCFSKICLFSISSINFLASYSCFSTSPISSCLDRSISVNWEICFSLSSMYCWLRLYCSSFKWANLFFLFCSFLKNMKLKMKMILKTIITWYIKIILWVASFSYLLFSLTILW